MGRAEVLPLGPFDTDYEEADLARARRPRLSLGTAYAFVDGAQSDRGPLGERPEDGGTTDLHNVTADAMFKLRGLSVLLEGYWRRGRRRAADEPPEDFDPGGGLIPARDGWGWNGQAGYVLPPTPLEFVARYGQVHGRAGSSLPRADEPGAGLGYYFTGHALKLQLDYHARWIGGDLETTAHVVRLQFQAAL